MIHSFKDLIVWQKSVDLVVKVYELTRNFPQEEKFCLTTQMRKAAISIPSNIAEGRYRGTRKDFLQYLRISYASSAELDTQIEIAKRLFKSRNINYRSIDDLHIQIKKMLNRMITTLNPKYHQQS